MAYVCLDCFRDCIRSAWDWDDPLAGISWSAEAPVGTVCAGCNSPLPESPGREAEARQLLDRLTA